MKKLKSEQVAETVVRQMVLVKISSVLELHLKWYSQKWQNWKKNRSVLKIEAFKMTILGYSVVEVCQCKQ